MRRRLVALLAVLAVASGPALLAAQDLPVVRVGDLGYTDASSEPLFGAAAGIFRRDGLDVKVSVLNGSGAIIAAIAGGSLEAGFSNAVSAAQAIQRGIPIIVLTPATEYPAERSDTLLVKARGSKLKTAADLDGKTVAVTTLGGGLEASARLWIDKHGGDSKTVHFLEVPFTEMAAALKAGRIDAAMLSEPVLTESRNDVAKLGDPFSLPTFALMARSRYGYELSAALLQPELDQALADGQLKKPVDAARWVADAQPYWRGIKR